jgi:hypothetical protein
MAKGFFVPNSVSSNFVSNQRNVGGDYKYDTAINEVGLNQQAALQSLNKQYSTTINNAYTNYLAASRGVRGSNMGQGYKEAYIQLAQDNLMSEIAKTNLTAANARAQIGYEGSQQIGNISQQFETEVSNMDRAVKSMNDYLAYVKTLTGKDDASQTYLNKDQMNLSLDNLYEVLFNAQPQAYLDTEGNMGMSYIQWVQKNLKDTSADMAWSQWLFGQGGYNQFREATRKGIQSLYRDF